MPSRRHPASVLSSSGSSAGSASDDDFSDWSDAVQDPTPCRSLFDGRELASAQAVLEHDAAAHGWELAAECARLGVDDYGRMRLINWIRREKATPEQLAKLTGKESLFTDDELLKPVLENDPLLQLSFESWSDDEDVQPQARRQTTRASGPSNSGTAPVPAVDTLSPADSSVRDQLSAANAQIARLKQLLDATLAADSSSDAESGCDSPPSSEAESVYSESSHSAASSGCGARARTRVGKGKGRETLGGTQAGAAKSKEKGKGKAPVEVRDDDTHYFNSYAQNEIHETMLKDTTRTLSYAHFILGNPQLFRGAVVMDVGCGTGILSMFAARAGAKKVYAIEASAFASKARENIKANGLQDVISVIQGKVEDIALPTGVEQVDIIISEWMGYMLLYESMLDSVLVARDRFLRPGGLMVPSQTRIVMAGLTGERLISERDSFWEKIYGFDLSPMKVEKDEEGVVEDIPASELCTSECIIKDINTHTATVTSLDFQSDFVLTHPSTASGPSAPIRALTTWFDTFFSADPKVHAGESVQVELHRFADDAFAGEVALPEGEKKMVSFTTGPKGKITHWKQVTFMLKKEVVLQPGQSIQGTFFCQKSKTNSRELDVEIHWRIEGPSSQSAQPQGVQYNVFKVC